MVLSTRSSNWKQFWTVGIDNGGLVLMLVNMVSIMLMVLKMILLCCVVLMLVIC